MNVYLNKKTTIIDLGCIDYKEAWDYQTRLYDEILAVKSRNRTLPPELHETTGNYLIFCEHPHVFTLGKSGEEKNLLVAGDDLKRINASFYHINRGGDITYHGPGQLVVYPVIDLENFFTDIHKYMRLLEEAVIRTCDQLGISAGRIAGLTGVWVGHEEELKARKICAMGVKTSRWVAMHGLAFNVNTDLDYFGYIVPCGIRDKAVTSVRTELGREESMVRISGMVRQHLAELFEMELI